MSKAKVIFILEGTNITIQCSEEDKIKDICQKYVTKIESNINSLLFLYGGNQMNMELKFKEQANSEDIDRKEMKVVVYKKENDDFNCPYCNKKIKLEKIDDIILSNNNIKDTINGIKLHLDNIIKLSSNNNISNQLKNINFLLNAINEDINKNNTKLKNLLKENNEIINNKLNTINNTIINEEIKYDNGRYVGQVVNDKKEGKGIFYYNSGSRYEGDFKNDKREGKGIYYYNDGERYEGDFKNDNMEGKGIYYYNNGNKYEGDWKNDNKEGKWIYYYNEEPIKGDRYEGDFIKDKEEGKGIYYYNNGDRSMGHYYNGKKIGKHTKLTKYGEVKEENY